MTDLPAAMAIDRVAIAIATAQGRMFATMNGEERAYIRVQASAALMSRRGNESLVGDRLAHKALQNAMDALREAGRPNEASALELLLGASQDPEQYDEEHFKENPLPA